MKAALSEVEFKQHSDIVDQTSKKNVLPLNANAEELLCSYQFTYTTLPYNAKQISQKARCRTTKIT